MSQGGPEAGCVRRVANQFREHRCKGPHDPQNQEGRSNTALHSGRQEYPPKKQFAHKHACACAHTHMVGCRGGYIFFQLISFWWQSFRKAGMLSGELSWRMVSRLRVNSKWHKARPERGERPKDVDCASKKGAGNRGLCNC